MSDIKERLAKVDEQVTRYTAGYPKSFRKEKLLKSIENDMKSLLKDIKDKEDGEEYNRLLDKLDNWYIDPRYMETYGRKKKKPPLADLLAYQEPKKEAKEAKEELVEMEIEAMETPSLKSGEKREVLETEEISSTPNTVTATDMFTATPRQKEEMKEEEKEEMTEEENEKMKEEEIKDEEKKEEDKVEEEISMEEIHNNIRKDERESVMREFNLVDPTIGTIDIPKERLGIEGKTIKILNDDIKYFINRFPDMLKMEASVYKKTNKKNKKALQDLHRRIQAKLSPDPKKEEGGKVGIILDADKFIDMKITELLATKTLEGLTPANLVDITEEPKSQGRDVGSYTLTRKGGRDIINNAPVYRAIPTTQPKQPQRKGEIKQSTIYENSGKTKVDIAKMELNNNPFIRQQKPKRLNIIL